MIPTMTTIAMRHAGKPRASGDDPPKIAPYVANVR